ncbi:farnesyl-diphosphate synthase [Desulfolithobacter dissulfuricans]|uniref:Farnesyl-diphosphate synthase n=1 Tax=Desulfolithobacter dissulfuricans TaxID=2795293 RepID=A0A915U2W7_9BACT|nr:farnesyl diphosphate synthase [Desulfolithobacter dissulfuricans]BCO10334.1 farnesyl-diphosphate synthase [Desulfolithobacter dissulfuricans]
MDIKKYLQSQRRLVEQALEEFMLRAEGDFKDHVAAMRYSLFVGGKRVRPILCLAAGRTICGDDSLDDQLLPVACALECIHTYSLIHDDLPAMDDDALRRGKPTNHMVFGEAQAILAGDGLLTFAFELLSRPSAGGLDPEARIQVIHTIARAAGPLGMVGGQALDIAFEGRNIEFDDLKTIHRSKTGALITASVQAGALVAGATEDQLQALGSYGNNIGLAFQIVDDLLNVLSTTEQLGKAAGSDAERGKATYPAFFGVEKTRQLAREAVERALGALDGMGEPAEPLRALARYIVERNR